MATKQPKQTEHRAHYELATTGSYPGVSKPGPGVSAIEKGGDSTIKPTEYKKGGRVKRK
jgi:hypothetical protein